MRRRGTRRSERQRELEWTSTLRWAELPADLRHQLAAELKGLLVRAGDSAGRERRQERAR